MINASILNGLVQLDQALFKKINTDWANGIFDVVMPFARNGLNWSPLYLFLLIFAILNFKTRGTWWAVFFLVTVALTDMTGNFLFKHNFQRLRPCNDPEFSDQVRLLIDHCGSGFSFISNHAANHFGMATFFFLTMRPVHGKWSMIAFFWAGLVAYAQVYVGIHYPLDVICGAVTGLIFGIITALTFNKRFGFAIFDNQLGPK